MTFRKPSELQEEADHAGVQGYSHYLRFTDKDDSSFWFYDGLHHPKPLRPFETIVPEAIKLGLSQANNRTFSLPLSYGIDQRILNGFIYFGPVGPDPNDKGLIEQRARHFKERASIYFSNWDEIYSHWLSKVSDVTESLNTLQIPQLKAIDDLSDIHSYSGIGSGFKLITAFNKASESLFLVWQYHFELLSLGYAAYLNFSDITKTLFPSITSSETIEMLAGSSIVLYKPKEEIQRLALDAVRRGIAHELLAMEPPQSADYLAEISNDSWRQDWIRTAKEWFTYSSGTGFYSDDGCWNDDWSVPWSILTNNIISAQHGDLRIRNLADTIAARDAATANYRSMLGATELKIFDEAYALAIKVAPYLEDHNFYIEHKFQTLFWSKIRAIGEELARIKVLPDANSIFMLNRWEVAELLFDVAASWANGSFTPSKLLLDTIQSRNDQHQRFEALTPTPAVGSMPKNLSDPLVSVLWGIDQQKVLQWASPVSANGATDIRGSVACAGVASGRVRIIKNNVDLGKLQQGEVLVCRTLAPSWATAFSRASAVISETGGVLSHAAIVCREFNIPSIVNAFGAMTLEDGSFIQVDAVNGLVVRLEGHSDE